MWVANPFCVSQLCKLSRFRRVRSTDQPSLGEIFFYLGEVSNILSTQSVSEIKRTNLKVNISLLGVSIKHISPQSLYPEARNGKINRVKGGDSDIRKHEMVSLTG